eukprot:4040365-Amphidinium_carterae.1
MQSLIVCVSLAVYFMISTAPQRRNRMGLVSGWIGHLPSGGRPVDSTGSSEKLWCPVGVRFHYQESDLRCFMW